MEIFQFERLNAYQFSRQLVKNIYELTKLFPQEEKFGLISQIRRAAVSIPSNLAEGSGRRSPKDQLHFFEIAFGSALEVYCQLTLAEDLGFISFDNAVETKQLIQSITKLISGLKKSTEQRINH